MAITDTQQKLKKAGIEVLGMVLEAKGYCVTCKRIVSLIEVHDAVLKSKVRVYIGKCSICGTEVFKKRS